MSEEQEIQKRERTLGEKFVDRFPSQIDDDPELKSKQERNVQWLIDALIPQSSTDVALTAGSVFMGGPIGRLIGKAGVGAIKEGVKDAPMLSSKLAAHFGFGDRKVTIGKMRDFLEQIMARKPYKDSKKPMAAWDNLMKQSPSMRRLKDLVYFEAKWQKAFDFQKSEEILERVPVGNIKNVLKTSWERRSANVEGIPNPKIFGRARKEPGTGSYGDFKNEIDEAIEGFVREAEEAHRYYFPNSPKPKK